MLCGVPPYYSKNQSKMYEMIVKNPVEFNPLLGLSAEAKDLLTKLLTKDPTKRLGAATDFEEIKSHPWFTGLDWPQLIAKKLPTPFQPEVEGTNWVRNFDSEYTSEGKMTKLLRRWLTSCVCRADKLVCHDKSCTSREIQEGFRSV